MADERDARLILRAEDRATKTFDQVAKSIANVREELQKQAKAAEAGTGSLAELQTSYKELQRLGDDLVKQQSAIKAFQKTSEVAENTAKRIEAASKAVEDYQSKLAGVEKVSDSQTTKLDRLRVNVDKLTDSYNKQAGRVDKARERLESLGLSATETDQQFNAIADSARLVAQGLVSAQTQIDNYDRSLKVAADAAGELAAKQEFLAKAGRAGISSEQIAFVTDFREANRLLQETIQEEAQAEATAAKATAQRQAALKDATREVLAGNSALEAQFAEIQRLDSEAASANAFRKVASDAAAAATDLGRFGATATAANASLTRFADEIRQTIAPAVAEVQTLDGALKQVDESASLAASTQKARASQYQDSLNKLSQANAALTQQASKIDAFRAQQRALQGLEADLGAAANKVTRLAAVLGTVPANAAEVQRELDQANRELERAGRAAQDAGTRLETLGNDLKRVGIDANDLEAAMASVRVGAQRSAPVFDTLTSKVGGNGKGFLGLKAYELQNLSFQINDVFTSLASGISPTQTLAQQGGQIVQIFPGILSSALRLLPVLGPLAAAFGLVAYQLYQTHKASEAVKGFEQIFLLSGNTAGYSAQQFGAAQLALEGLGNKADVAKEALREFVKAGLNPASLDDFIKTADQIAKVTGESLPQAAEKLAAAYSGGYKQISDLNDLLGGPLNDAQLQAIQNDFDAGRAAEARTKAQEAFNAAAQRSADKAKSEWSVAAERLGKAFADLNRQLGLSEAASAIAKAAYVGLIAIIQKVQSVAEGAAVALKALALSRAVASGDTAAVGRIIGGSRAPKQRDAPKKQAAAVRERTSGGQEILRQQQTELKNAKLLTAEERLHTAEIDARNKAAAAGASNVEIAQAAVNARKIEQSKIDKENASAARKSESAAAKAAREAETRQNRINALTAELQNVFIGFNTVGKDNPFQKIQDDAEKALNNIRTKFAALGKLGVTQVAGKSQADFEAQVKSYAEVQTRLETQKKQEQDLNDLLEQRKIRLAEIADAVKAREITPLDGVAQSQKVVDDLKPKLQELITRALEFNKALRTATYDPKLEAFIAKLQGELRNIGGGDEIKAALDTALKDAQTNLAAIVGQRDEYVKVQNALVTAGLKTSTDAQEAIQREYDATRPKILAAADAVQAIIDRMVALGLVSPEVGEALRGALNVTRAETKKLDADIVQLKNAAQQALAGAIGDFITSLGTQIASVLDGTSSLKDALKGIAGAALSFAASFTKAIAQAIVQLVALKIARAALTAVGFGLHDGGIAGVGQATFKRRVPVEVFAGAIRYHSGGVAGLLPNEIPAILEKGEEVITRDDPRHRGNGGGTAPSAPQVTIKNINLFDAGEAVSQGANTTEGQRAILNVVQQNRTLLGLP